MNWQEALRAMRQGLHVVRESKAATPSEPIRLAAAWTDKGEAARVFQGVGSKVLFIPDQEDEEARDWEVSP